MILDDRGLLVSKMHETAKSIVMNLISLIERYGYVLNGARYYYTNRRYGHFCLCYAFKHYV